MDHAGLVLEEFLLLSVEEEERDALVSKLVTYAGEWNWVYLNGKLPEEILSLIAGTDVPKQDLGEDMIIWGLETYGRFRFKSAYKLAAEELEEVQGSEWKKLWKWKGPNRVKHFLWLTYHEKLLTNKERAKRKLTEDSECKFPGCEGCDETTEHILRSCEK